MFGTAARRFLIIEDEFLIAIMLQDMLRELGHQVVGVARSAEDAKAIIRADPHAFDAATLDINLEGIPAHEVAKALDALGVPFIVTTGYDGDHFPEYQCRSFVHKPFVVAQLKRALHSLEPRRVDPL